MSNIKSNAALTGTVSVTARDVATTTNIVENVVVPSAQLTIAANANRRSISFRTNSDNGYLRNASGGSNIFELKANVLYTIYSQAAIYYFNSSGSDITIRHIEEVY